MLCCERQRSDLLCLAGCPLQSIHEALPARHSYMGTSAQMSMLRLATDASIRV